MNWLRQGVVPGIAWLILLCSVALLAGQETPQATTPDYSGLYGFLQEGEFVQLGIDGEGRVTGFVSRYGDTEGGRAFVDQIFKQGKVEGKNLSFSTQTVQGVSYAFKGVVERGDGKSPGDEAYYVLKGTLTEIRTDASKKTSSKSQAVAFKSFPQDLDSAPPRKE